MKKLVALYFVVSIIMGFVLAVPAFAAQADNVLSENIMEADGTTGQDTNSGSGIKTGHIQDGAITNGKIADGAVTDAKITGPISASKISSTGLDADTLDGKHSSDLAPVVHVHDQTDVNGLVDALNSKSDVTHNHDTDYSPIAHNHDGIYQKHYNNVIVVSLDGKGDFTDPIAAVNSITDSSANNLYMVKLMPGVYDIGGQRLEMKEYVDIEGSGEHITKITGYHDVQFGVINTASNAALRNLTVEHRGGPYRQYGLHVLEASPEISNVTVIVHGGGSADAVGIYNNINSFAVLNNVTVILYAGNGNWSAGIASVASSPVMNNVTVNVLGGSGNIYGLYFGNSSGISVPTVRINNADVTVDGTTSYGVYVYDEYSVEMKNSRVTASEGVGAANFLGASLDIKHSSITSTLNTISGNSSSVTKVAFTELEGVAPISNTSGVIKCIGAYDGNYDPVTCP